MLGHDIIIALILKLNVISRHIYLSSGYWMDELDGSTHKAEKWLRDYPIALDKVPFFTKTIVKY